MNYNSNPRGYGLVDLISGKLMINLEPTFKALRIIKPAQHRFTNLISDHNLCSGMLVVVYIIMSANQL